AAVFKGEGGEIERKPEANCVVKIVRHGKTTEELWDKMIDGRQEQPGSLNTQELVDVWIGKSENEYGKLAIIGTTAIALKLIKVADSNTEALLKAEKLWDQRNKLQLLN
ncbi:MAG: anthranilate phosphoribosyltransferase, partial [Gammaproteobacteria bacterium]